MSLELPGTGVDITIDEDITYFSKAGSYSASEEVTGTDPSDPQGAFGQFTVTIRDEPVVKTYMDKSIRITDGKNGSTLGNIRGLSGSGITATINADSRLAQAAVMRQMPPHKGTLGAAIRSWLASCGIVERVIVDDAIGATQVVLPGWRAVVYDQLKKLAVAYEFEMALVSDNIVIRPLRTRVAQNLRDMNVSWAHDATQLAQTVEGYYYNTTWKDNALAYPQGGWSDDVSIYSVNAGETVEVEIPLDSSLVSIQQPQCVPFVSRSHESSSVYSVSGNDGVAITPAQWAASGGSLVVEIGEDTKSLKVIITGSTITEYAPYSIAVAAGPSDTYSSLRIVGSGAFMEQKTWTLPAHIDPDRATEELGATVDNEFFASHGQLHRSLSWTAARFAGPRQTISVGSRGIHRRGDSGSAIYPTIDDVNALYPGATIDDLYAALGPTIDDWNEKLYALVRSDFENQVFGNVAGARTRYEDCWYRIRSADISFNQVSYAAEWDTTITDAFPGIVTIAEWNAQWAGKAINDFNAAPLQGVPELAA